MTYDEAVDALYQGPMDAFVAERKRLAGELKAGGDKDAAARLGKLARPAASAWAVNQLWWHARDAFETMFATAARLRAGDLDAATQAAHRDAVAALRARAARLLGDAGAGANEAVLRRVTTTLAALAVAGGFAPDRPGALAADRESPGFAALGVTTMPSAPAAAPAPASAPVKHAPKAAPAKAADGHAHQAKQALAAAKHAAAEAEKAAIARAQAERRAAEQDRARKAADRHRLEAALRAAKGDVTLAQRDVTKLEAELADARAKLEQLTALVDDVSEQLRHH